MSTSRDGSFLSDLGDLLFSVHHVPETRAYIAMSILDIMMTWFLLAQQTVFVESNPLAAYFIDHWGPRGMVYFKMVMVAFVCLVVQIISRKRPIVARSILQAGTLIVGIVVIYSAMLYIRHGHYLPEIPYS